MRGISSNPWLDARTDQENMTNDKELLSMFVDTWHLAWYIIAVTDLKLL